MKTVNKIVIIALCFMHMGAIIALPAFSKFQMAALNRGQSVVVDGVTYSKVKGVITPAGGSGESLTPPGGRTAPASTPEDVPTGLPANVQAAVESDPAGTAAALVKAINGLGLNSAAMPNSTVTNFLG